MAADAHGADGSPNGKPRAAAFFDLDKTLMAGSSGIYFARAAYETGMITRRRLARDVFENLRFRLRGSTDDRADDVRRRVGKMIAGVRVRDLERLSPRVLAGVLPRLYPEMLARAYAHQDAGELVYILTAASQEMADLLAHVLAFDGERHMKGVQLDQQAVVREGQLAPGEDRDVSPGGQSEPPLTLPVARGLTAKSQSTNLARP